MAWNQIDVILEFKCFEEQLYCFETLAEAMSVLFKDSSCLQQMSIRILYLVVRLIFDNRRQCQCKFAIICPSFLLTASKDLIQLLYVRINSWCGCEESIPLYGLHFKQNMQRGIRTHNMCVLPRPHATCQCKRV